MESHNLRVCRDWAEAGGQNEHMDQIPGVFLGIYGRTDDYEFSLRLPQINLADEVVKSVPRPCAAAHPFRRDGGLG